MIVTLRAVSQQDIKRLHSHTSPLRTSPRMLADLNFCEVAGAACMVGFKDGALQG